MKSVLGIVKSKLGTRVWRSSVVTVKRQILHQSYTISFNISDSKVFNLFHHMKQNGKIGYILVEWKRKSKDVR